MVFYKWFKCSPLLPNSSKFDWYRSFHDIVPCVYVTMLALPSLVHSSAARNVKVHQQFWNNFLKTEIVKFYDRYFKRMHRVCKKYQSHWSILYGNQLHVSLLLVMPCIYLNLKKYFWKCVPLSPLTKFPPEVAKGVGVSHSNFCSN